ncbi:hypothetical protein [Elioraea sp.]|uniref:hypothetical protein n=1 Tax=Elioraea sp. TaxID=2185103 RepID=UPI003F70A5CD
MEPRGLPIDLEQIEAAIHRALGLLCTEAKMEAFKLEQDAPAAQTALKLLHLRRFQNCLGHELMTIAAGLRIADERAEGKFLCTFRVDTIDLDDQNQRPVNLRYACNKIIHTRTLAWDWTPSGLEGALAALGGTTRTPHRGPVARLLGKQGGKEWKVNLNITTFLESSAMAVRVFKDFETRFSTDIRQLLPKRPAVDSPSLSEGPGQKP